MIVLAGGLCCRGSPTVIGRNNQLERKPFRKQRSSKFLKISVILSGTRQGANSYKCSEASSPPQKLGMARRMIRSVEFPCIIRADSGPPPHCHRPYASAILCILPSFQRGRRSSGNSFYPKVHLIKLFCKVGQTSGSLDAWLDVVAGS